MNITTHYFCASQELEFFFNIEAAHGGIAIHWDTNEQDERFNPSLLTQLYIPYNTQAKSLQDKLKYRKGCVIMLC